MSCICALKPLPSISSASSRMSVFSPLTRNARRLIISNTRPGVPETICTPLSNRRISYSVLLPPTQAYAVRPMWWPMLLHKSCVCTANYRVGDKISACVSRICGLHACNRHKQNAEVLPEPDEACATRSLPFRKGTINRFWIAVGCL